MFSRQCENPSGKQAHTTTNRKRMLVHSRFSSQSHCGPIRGLKKRGGGELVRVGWPLLKKKKKARAWNHSPNLPPYSSHARKKSHVAMLCWQSYLYLSGFWISVKRRNASLATARYLPLHNVFQLLLSLSTVFHSINSPNNSPFSDSVLAVLTLSYCSFQLYISLWKSLSALI